MKRIFALLITCFTFTYFQAQNVSVGTPATLAKSALTEYESPVAAPPGGGFGVIFPRVTTAQRPACAAPQAGMVVFNTTLGQFQRCNGAAWGNLGGADNFGNHMATADLQMSGFDIIDGTGANAVGIDPDNSGTRNLEVNANTNAIRFNPDGDANNDFSLLSGTGAIIDTDDDGTPDIALNGGGNVTAAGFLRSNSSVVVEDPGAGTNAVTIQSSTPLALGYTLTLPPDDGAANQLLRTDGAGNLTWATVAGGGDFLADGTVTMTGDFNVGGQHIESTSGTVTLNPSLGNAEVTVNDGADQIFLDPNGDGTQNFRLLTNSLAIDANGNGNSEIDINAFGSLALDGNDAGGPDMNWDAFGNTRVLNGLTLGAFNGIGPFPDGALQYNTVTGDVEISNGGVFIPIGSDAGNGNIALSDARFKTDVKTLEGALEKTLKLNGVSWNWKKEEFPERNFSDDREIGVIAQEVEAVIPEVVIEGKDGYRKVKYGNLVGLLIEAIKEQQQIIDAQNVTADSQRNEIEDLKVMVEQLNQQVSGINSILTDLQGDRISSPKAQNK